MRVASEWLHNARQRRAGLEIRLDVITASSLSTYFLHRIMTAGPVRLADVIEFAEGFPHTPVDTHLSKLA